MRYSTIASYLKKADAVLSSEGHWIKGMSAAWKKRNFYFLDAVPPKSREASCWCLVGAVHKVTPTYSAGCDVVDFLDVVVINSRSRAEGAVHFNDTQSRSFKQVKAFLAKAIALAESKGRREFDRTEGGIGRATQ